jgi:hypothetical protein
MTKQKYIIKLFLEKNVDISIKNNYNYDIIKL